MKRVKKWKRFIALLVVLALVIQCNFNAIALDSNEEKQQQAGAVVEEMMAEETATEAKTEEPKQETVEEKKDEPQEKQEMVEKTEELKEETKQEVTEEKKEEPKQETAEEKKEESKQETAEAKQEAAKEDEQKEIAEEKSQEEKEEKEEAKTSFSYFDNRVSIQATADKKANFPQNTVLKADYVKPGSAEYKQAAALAESKYGEDGKELEFVFYDIYFESDGERIEPEAGNVTVTVDFKKAVLPDSEETESSTHEVIHINGSNVEKVTDQVTTNDQGAATSMKFTSDSFSIYGDMKVSTLADDPKEYKMDNMITSAVMKVNINGTWYELKDIPKGTKVPQNAQVEVTISYNPGDIYLNVNDRITYQLPSVIKLASEENGKVTDGPEEPGIYKISTDGLITITLTNEEYLENYNHHLQNGKITFKGQFQENQISEGGKQTIDFGGIELEVDFEQDSTVTKAEIRVDKNDNKDSVLYDSSAGKYYIRYNIVVTTPADNTETIPNVTVEDVVDAGSTSYIESFAVEGEAGTDYVGTWNPSAKVWTIGNVAPGSTYTLTLRGYLSDSALPVYGATTVKNWAYLKSNGEDKHKDDEDTSLNNSLNIEKKNAGYDKTNGTVKYTVTVKAPGSNRKPVTDVTVKDVFGSNKKYVSSYTSMTPSEGTTVAIDANNPKQLNWIIGTMNPGDTKTLTYTVNIDDNIFVGSFGEGVDRTLVNTASLFVNNEPKANKESKVRFRKQWIHKDGVLQSDGRVKFTVVANTTEYGSLILNKDFVITDTLSGSDWVYDETVGIAVTYYQLDANGNKTNTGSYTIPLAANQTTWSWGTGSAGFPGANYCFSFVYYAKLKAGSDPIGSPGISNTAGIVIGEGGSNYKHSSHWEGNGNDYGGLEKQFDSKEGNIATWTSTISHTVFNETKYQDYYRSESGFSDWFFTKEQIEKVEVYKKNADGTKAPLTKGTDYSIAPTDTTDKPKGFEITFIDSTGNGIAASADDPIYITYQTTLNTNNLKPAEEGKYRNHAKLIIGTWSKEAYADCSYLQEQKIAKSAGNYNVTTKELTWNISVNVTGTLSGNKTVKDTLPDGLEYVRSSVTKGSKASQTNAVVTCLDKKNIIIELTNLQKTEDKNAWVKINVVTKIVDEKFLVSNETKEFINKAELWDGDEKLDESTAKKSITNRGLTKGGEYSAPNMTYTITVNPDGHDMLAGVDKITIVDTMGTGLMLKQTTLKAVDKNGNKVDITDLKIESLKNEEDKEYTRFSFKIPDDRKVVITYEAFVMGSVGSTTSVTNSVRYYGEIESPGVEESETIQIQESAASIEGKPTLFIKKYDGTDPELKRPLEGAVYQLYEVTEKDGIIQHTLLQTQTSDKTGKVTFSSLSKDKVYAFKEISTVDNYYIDEQNKRYTYIAYDEAKVPEIIKSQVNIVSTSFTFNRYNYKGEIKVTKEFKGNRLTDGLYYFGLFDESKNLVMINEERQIKSIEVVNGAFKGNENSVTFKYLNRGTYYVYETTADGKILEKNTDGSVVINNKKFKVTGEGTAIEVSTDNPNRETAISNEEIPLQVTLKATKNLVNESASTVKVNNFQFGLYEVTDGIISAEPVETVASDENGDITFSTLTYPETDAEKEFNYIVKEIIPADTEKADNITYDTTQYPIKVSIGNNLMITVTSGERTLTGTGGVYWLPEQADHDPTASFINKYDASASVTFAGKKTLENANFDLGDGDYTFNITGPNPGTGEEITLSATNAADGTIKYPTLTWRLQDLADSTIGKQNIYQYTVSEANGGKTIAGVTYSSQRYTVVVTVTNTGTGMTASYKVDTEESKSLDFINTYSATETVTIPGTKSLDGAALKEGMFEFAITETTEGVSEENKYKANVFNAADGTVTLPLPTYTQADDGKTFAYEISEVNKSEAGFTYSAEKYQLTITVTDNQNGTLTIGKSITKDGQETEVAFANTFRGSAELTKIDDQDGLDAENPKVLAGAEFELYKEVTDGDDIKIGETLTTDEDGKITATDLEEGDYYFVEITPPKGYMIVRDENGDPVHYTFSIGPDNPTSGIVANAKVTAGNTQTKVYIKKTDADGNPLSGAKMAVINPETNQIVVEPWTTDGTVKEITGKLIAGKTYYLRELEAPKGYLVSADEEFTVPEKAEEDILEVTMTDPKDEGKEKLGSISVIKKIVSREIAGDYELYVNDATYYVGLFTDPDGNHPYGQNAIREAHIVNGSASEPVVYEKLPTGTYYVLETTKNGTPIPMNSEVTDDKSSFVCEVTDGGTNAVEINTEAEKMEGKVNLTNAYLELPDGFAYRAFIDVTKKVLENGVEKATDETFYAGIFTGETENAPMTLVELKNNGKVTVEVPLGGPDGDQPITYYVFETDAQGNKLDKDTFIYIVSGEGQVSVSREKIQSDITITNNLISEVSLEILKVDEDGYGLEGAKFQITSADGKAVLKKWKSDEESKEITLAPGTYKLIETAAPKGYIQGSDVTITISRDGTISIDGDDASLDDSVIEYVNQIDDSTTSKQDKKNGGTSKTGDPTHIMFYAILMAAALLGCMGVTRRKKGRHDR